MKISKFLKDIFTTGLSQFGVLIFGVLIIKIMTAALTKEYFGLFTLVRRWVTVLLPMVTLNLSIGLTRYTSCEKENARFFLNISLITSTALSAVVLIILSLFPKNFSIVFFKSTDYSTFVLILVVFLAANFVELITYSYFRGKLDMNTANILRILFYGFPLLPGLVILLLKTGKNITSLYLYFLIYSLWGLVIGSYFLRKEKKKTPAIIKNLLNKKWKVILTKSRGLFSFSLTRIPSVLFNSLILSFPVFIAAYKISVVAAGYMGLVVAVLRLLEIFSMPFNMILLPKFSSLKKNEEIENIRNYSLVVLDFIFTFLPILVIMIFGLSHFIVFIWFGSGYLTVTGSIATTILSSMFYLSFALIRGILDGLYVFPFVNIISLSGFSVIAVLSLIKGSTVFQLSIAFGLGLVILGVVSIVILIKKLNLSISRMVILKAIISSTVVFLVLKVVDDLLMELNLKDLHSFAIYVLYRVPLVVIVWFFYWRKTLWYQEVIKRINFQ